MFIWRIPRKKTFEASYFQWCAFPFYLVQSANINEGTSKQIWKCALGKTTCFYSFIINLQSKLKKISTLFLRHLPRSLLQNLTKVSWWNLWDGIVEISLLDIARYRAKTLKKEKERKKMRKSETTTINAFLLSLFCIEKLYFFSKHISKYLVYIITFVLQFFRMAGNWKCNNKTPTPQ